MSNPWFRFYHEFAYDPKVQKLSEVNQRRYVMILCMRCQKENPTALSDDDIAFVLRISADRWNETKKLLKEQQLIDENNLPTAWEKRQFISDNSKNRVAAYRERKREKNDKNQSSDIRINGGNDDDETRSPAFSGVRQNFPAETGGNHPGFPENQSAAKNCKEFPQIDWQKNNNQSKQQDNEKCNVTVTEQGCYGNGDVAVDATLQKRNSNATDTDTDTDTDIVFVPNTIRITSGDALSSENENSPAPPHANQIADATIIAAHAAEVKGDVKNESQTTATLDKKPRKSNRVLLSSAEQIFPSIEDRSLISEWMSIRRAKRAAPITERVCAAIEREASKAGMTLTAAITMCCERGWQTFDASWVRGNQSSGAQASLSRHVGFKNKDYTVGIDEDGKINF
jgi:plastocyanin